MERPERLLLYKARAARGDVRIEALFLHEGRPIFFEARLPFEEREFYADILATNEEDAALFTPEELLAACYCSGCLEPEHKRNTKATDALMKKCDVAGEGNDLL